MSVFDAISRSHPVCETDGISTAASVLAHNKTATPTTEPKVSKGNWANGEECNEMVDPAKRAYCFDKRQYNFDERTYLNDKTNYKFHLWKKGYSQDDLFSSDIGNGKAAANLQKYARYVEEDEDRLEKDWAQLHADEVQLNADRTWLNDEDRKLTDVTPTVANEHKTGMTNN
jgi:hypothetical protein